jgi:hypothetical protein
MEPVLFDALFFLRMMRGFWVHILHLGGGICLNPQDGASHLICLAPHYYLSCCGWVQDFLLFQVLHASDIISVM